MAQDPTTQRPNSRSPKVISYLRGNPISKNHESCIIDVKGVGYELFCSQGTLDSLTEQKEVSIFAYTHVRPEIIHLFGFASLMEKKLFLSLIKVNGVGPKMAIGILSGATTERIAEMIETADIKALMLLPKVGKKKAEQIVLSLKGQITGDPVIETKVSGHHEITSALVHLGFRINDVDPIVRKMADDISIQEGIRLGLATLTNPSPTTRPLS